jgi:hypothetical protein
MPQINNGKSPPWVAGEIVTAAGLNGMIDSATLDPSAITAQANFTTLTGNEYTLIVDAAGLLKKTQLKNALSTGNDIVVGNILNPIGGVTIAPFTEVRLNAPNIKLQNNATVGSNIDIITHSGIQLSTSNLGIGLNAPNGDISFLSRTVFAYTGAIKLPVGTTAQRPATPVAGDTRFNSTLATAETYNGSDWSSTALKVAVLTRELTSGTTYTLTPSAWTDIPYNTINESTAFVVNAASFTGTLSSTGTGTITLTAGTYVIEAESSIQSNGGSGGVVTRVYNNTSSSVVKIGTTTYCNDYSHGTSIVYAVFTLSTTSNISIQYYANVVGNTNALVAPVGTQEVVFTSKITKLS